MNNVERAYDTHASTRYFFVFGIRSNIDQRYNNRGATKFNISELCKLKFWEAASCNRFQTNQCQTFILKSQFLETKKNVYSFQNQQHNQIFEFNNIVT